MDGSRQNVSNMHSRNVMRIYWFDFIRFLVANVKYDIALNLCVS